MQVQRGLEWSGRSLGFGPEAETSMYLAPRGAWAGLLPYPPWWAWFGPEYAPLVVGHLPEAQVRVVGNGLFHWRSEEPQDRDELLAAISGPRASEGHSRGLRRLLSRRDSVPAATWLPPDLLATVDNSGPHLTPTPDNPVPLRISR